MKLVRNNLQQMRLKIVMKSQFVYLIVSFPAQVFINAKENKYSVCLNFFFDLHSLNTLK